MLFPRRQAATAFKKHSKDIIDNVYRTRSLEHAANLVSIYKHLGSGRHDFKRETSELFGFIDYKVASLRFSPKFSTRQ